MLRLTLADNSSSPVWRAQVQYDWAVLAVDNGDLTTAQVLAEQAHTTSTTLGMLTLTARAAALLARLDELTAAPSTSSVTFDGLSERELDVLRLIAEGCSNRDIGERLFISQHTAANHVRSILQKTGCANRAEAAAYAVHRRLVQ